MERLFYPQSLVIVGVSDSPSNLAKEIVANLDGARFEGKIYCVGRRAGRLNHRQIFDSIGAIEAVPDLAVLLIPADTIPETLEACGRKGIRYAVIEAGGFSEFHEEQGELEGKILEIADRWNITFMGPNCVGVINTENGLVLPFYPVDPQNLLKGNVSFISQSGGLVEAFLKRCGYENLRCSKLLSIGNKLMLDENDFLEFLIADPAARTIGLYLESVMDGRRLMEAARSSEKPIVALKGNRRAASREIARFHTAALAGDERVFDAALRQCGVHRVENLAEMIRLLKIFTLPLLKGRNLILISRSGGQAVLLADFTEAHGFNLAKVSPQLSDFLKRKVKTGVINKTNPLDLGDVFDLKLYDDIIALSLQDKRVDGVVLFHHNPETDTEPTQALIRSAAALSRRYQKPVVFCTLPRRDNLLSSGEEEYFPIFDEADLALKALASSLRHFENLQKRPASAPGKKHMRQETPRAMASEIMGADETFGLLKASGLAVADYAVVSSLEEALEAAARIGYPVALKIATPIILHKTEKAGVKLDVRDAAALKQACADMKAEQYLIQPMVSGCEIILGAKRDPQFGPIVLLGMGGILAELLDDVAVRVAPLDERMSVEMMNEFKGSVILNGYRGNPAIDKRALSDALIGVSKLLFEHPEIVSLDINPLVVLEERKGAILVDAKIERISSLHLPADS
jgi:acetate---CoA ligase (ADP-forming)